MLRNCLARELAGYMLTGARLQGPGDKGRQVTQTGGSMQITHITQIFTLFFKRLGNTCSFIIPRSNQRKSSRPSQKQRGASIWQHSVGRLADGSSMFPTMKSEKPLIITNS